MAMKYSEYEKKIKTINTKRGELKAELLKTRTEITDTVLEFSKALPDDNSDHFHIFINPESSQIIIEELVDGVRGKAIGRSVGLPIECIPELKKYFSEIELE